jgi:hypothetical protein
MQTLLDPYELGKTSFPPLPAVAVKSDSVLDVDVELSEPAADDVKPLPPSPDSSGRLRCWCSED